MPFECLKVCSKSSHPAVNYLKDSPGRRDSKIICKPCTSFGRISVFFTLIVLSGRWKNGRKKIYIQETTRSQKASFRLALAARLLGWLAGF